MIKKLLLSLLLALSTTSLFAGGCLTKNTMDAFPLLAHQTDKNKEPISINSLSNDVLRLIIRALLKTGSATDIHHCLATSRKFRELISEEISEHDRLIIQKYTVWLKNSWYNPLSLFFIICIYHPESSFNPPWLDKALSHTRGVGTIQAIKLCIFFEFVDKETVELPTARLIINSFLEHNVDLNATYNIKIEDLKNDEYYPYVTDDGSTLVALDRILNCCEAIIQAVKEALER